ncbi:MAG: calcium-binding protein [Pseudooceanicola sp.]|jgi:Ca2+-binding RTX toxin-like protein|nr:calcium-binding protein [Pseudooceanicola sp.]
MANLTFAETPIPDLPYYLIPYGLEFGGRSSATETVVEFRAFYIGRAGQTVEGEWTAFPIDITFTGAFTHMQDFATAGIVTSVTYSYEGTVLLSLTGLDREYGVVWDVLRYSNDPFVTLLNGDDTIRATIARSDAHGYQGNDIFISAGVRNSFDGGPGDDTAYGNHGDDRFVGGDGNDTFYGGTGLNHLYGDAGRDRLYGGSDWDYLDGGAGRDHLFGRAEFDRMYGRGGNDRLVGGSGDDRLDGGAGDDRLKGGTGRDQLDGGLANDTLSGGADRDSLTGGKGNDVLRGGDGVDSLEGGLGDDMLYGDADVDTLTGGKGNDSLIGGDGNDTLNGGSGDDVLDGGTGHDTLTGGRGADTLRGGAGRDVLRGGAGDDSLSGGAQDDTFVFKGFGSTGASGSDLITDFHAGDQIGLYDVANPSGIAFAQDGDDVTIALAGNLITLSDATLAEVQAAVTIYATSL